MTAPKARGNLQVVAGVTKKPDLSDPVLRAKLAKGMGHNYYGEPAWPSDLLYIFPVVILGTIACCVGLAVMEPTQLGEPADPFATPWRFCPSGTSSPPSTPFASSPTSCWACSRWRRCPSASSPCLSWSPSTSSRTLPPPVATSVFLIGTFYAIWMGIGAAMPIDKAITLGVF